MGTKDIPSEKATLAEQGGREHISDTGRQTENPGSDSEVRGEREGQGG